MVCHDDSDGINGNGDGWQLVVASSGTVSWLMSWNCVDAAVSVHHSEVELLCRTYDLGFRVVSVNDIDTAHSQVGVVIDVSTFYDIQVDLHLHLVVSVRCVLTCMRILDE
jgi:hypothetical protein